MMISSSSDPKSRQRNRWENEVVLHGRSAKSSSEERQTTTSGLGSFLFKDGCTTFDFLRDGNPTSSSEEERQTICNKLCG